MSSPPSTPRSTRSASPTSAAMLTPGQKIKAMMAQFDSDSDSDNGQSKPNKSTGPTITNRPQTTTQSEDGSDEDEEIIMPRGRIAARLQAQSDEHTNQSESALDRVSKAFRSEREREQSDEDEVISDDDDDLPKAGGPRRQAHTTKTPEPDTAGRSPSPARSESPLFVPQDDINDEPEEQPQPNKNARFLALVAQKRQEREEKETAEAEKRAARLKLREQLSSDMVISDAESEDGASGRRLTQQARPARKAGKKAMEEMNRETQRMSRNMQLAHQAQTKKKISKESFFARFNFMQPEQPEKPVENNNSSTSVSQNSSDAEARKRRETPRTSPVQGPEGKPDGPVKEVDPSTLEFPSLGQMIAEVPKEQPEQPVVGRMEEAANPQPAPASKEKKPVAPRQIRLSRQTVAQNQEDDSDSDLEIVTDPGKCRRLAAFENIPAKKHAESSALQTLKALAHINDPTRRPKMNNAELSASLLLKARQQAAKERQERIEELRAKGVHIETAEERQAMEDQLDNLVEKARKEAEDIAKQERAAKKKGEVDSDEDDDYELSGSDAEGFGDGDGDDEDEDEDEEADEGEKDNLFDAEAGEDESEDDADAMSVDENIPTQRRKRATRVISDDEDEDQAPTTPARPANPPIHSVERPSIPGLPSNDMTMSLTQAFAGTLGSPQDSQPGSATIPHSLPDPARMMERQDSDSQMIIKDSQEQQAEPADLLPRYTPSDARISESPAPRAMSHFSQVPDPTQDEGFVLSPFDPSKRFLGTPTSTIETVLVDRDESRNNSPAPERRMKQLRRGRAELSMIEENEEGDFEVDASAFNIMKKAAKKPSEPYDRKKSKAKDVVEEAAEESEDEYAGLGGASDEDQDEENAHDRQMIDDNSGETVDEKQLAALNALHQRNADEKQVAKLMKDITTGALRRRRGADDDFDLDDSDDEMLARRREKQREFARMRKALMADEKIGEIAENPKKAAFFKAIEDRDDDDGVGLGFLDEAPGEQEDQSSQDVAENPDESNKRKRPLDPSTEENYNRPPPQLRRKPASAMSKKPATLAEIRETVSFLTERPEYDSFQEDASMDDDEQQPDTHEASDEREESPVHVHPRRTRGPVVDRLALLRQASSNSAGSSNTRLAFHAGSDSGVGFRPPPMLRKTTTGSSSSDSSRRMSKSSTGSGAPMAKKGAVNYYTAAREKERERELRTRQRAGGSNITALLNKHAGNRLGSLGGGQWE